MRTLRNYCLVPEPSGSSQEGKFTIATTLGLAGVLLLIVFSAFFVAAEFALVAVDRAELEAKAAAGSRRAATAVAVVRRLSHHLSGAQLGVTLTSLLLGFIAEPTIVSAIRSPVASVVGERAAEGVSIGLALGGATVGAMLLGELIPKGLVLARPLKVTLYLAGPLKVFSLIFRPLISSGNAMSNWIVRRFGVEPAEELTAARSVEELRALLHASGEGGTLAKQEVKLLTRSLGFANRTAQQVMVPRRDVVTIPDDATGQDLVELATQTGFSRFPVVVSDLDEFSGVVATNDLFGIDVALRANLTVATLSTQTLAVPETRVLADLMKDLQTRGIHLAVVVDEHGTSTGIVTIEDVLEAIVGDIADEYDAPQLSPSVVGPDGTVTVPGGFRPDEVFDLTGLRIPEGPFSTIAGFVLAQLGQIPTENTTLRFEDWDLTVVDMDRHRIAELMIRHDISPSDELKQ